MLANRVRMGSNSKNIDDSSGSPGNNMLIAGDMNAGFFGVTPSSQLITGYDLLSMIGASTTNSQFSSEGWLKFAYQGKIQFVAKKPIRHSISWNGLNSINCIYGDKTVTIGKLTYKVRLMRSAHADPAGGYNGTIVHNGEWNKLMLPIHIKAKDKSWDHPNNVEADVSYWGIDFTDEDLLTHRNYGSGSYSWCQEVAHTSTVRIGRGLGGVSSSNAYAPSTSTAHYGFRPVLELV